MATTYSLIPEKRDGSALASGRRFVAAQGGDAGVVDRPGALSPSSGHSLDLLTPEPGFVAAIDALAIGNAARDLGAGRQAKGDQIDLAAGVVLRAKVGQALSAGQAWATLYAGDEARLAAGRDRLCAALRLATVPSPADPLVYGVVYPDGNEVRLV